MSDTAETIYVLPVHDASMRLLGTVELEDLVLAEPDRPIESLIAEPQYAVSAWDDQEAVARLMQSADLFAVPVVEEDDRLVGIVTIDDAVDVLQEEESEDIARGGATEPHTIELTRETNQAPDVTSRMQSAGIGYLRVAAIGAKTADVVKAQAADLVKGGAATILVDIRRTSGGSPSGGTALPETISVDRLDLALETPMGGVAIGGSARLGQGAVSRERHRHLRGGRTRTRGRGRRAGRRSPSPSSRRRSRGSDPSPCRRPAGSRRHPSLARRSGRGRTGRSRACP